MEFLGEGAAVLIRAMDPLKGNDTMRNARGEKRADKGQHLNDQDLGSGPSKLTQAFYVDLKSLNKQDLAKCDFMWLEDGKTFGPDDIATTPRVGIDSAGEEWAQKPLRFYVKGNKSVSKVDKKAEGANIKVREVNFIV